MLFVYWFEGNPGYAPRIETIFRSVMAQGHQLCTSLFTKGEVMVGAYRRGDEHQAAEIDELFHAPEIEVLPITALTIERYARIRGEHRVHQADAIHLAAASLAQTTFFLTNDQRLLGKRVEGIGIIAGLDINVY